MRLFIAVICVLSLAACAGSTGKQQAAMGVQPVVKPAVNAPGRTPVPEPRPAVPSRVGAKKPGGGTSATASAQAAAQQQASAAALAPAVDMDKLAGADRPRIRSLLGPADEVRAQPPGETWIYREGKCSVELYLFPQVSASQYAVLGHRFLPSSLGEEERTACLTKLASRTPAS